MRCWQLGSLLLTAVRGGAESLKGSHRMGDGRNLLKISASLPLIRTFLMSPLLPDLSRSTVPLKQISYWIPRQSTGIWVTLKLPSFFDYKSNVCNGCRVRAQKIFNLWSAILLQIFYKYRIFKYLPYTSASWMNRLLQTCNGNSASVFCTV